MPLHLPQLRGIKMNNQLRDLYVDFQIADFDDDLIAICVRTVNILKWGFQEALEGEFEPAQNEWPSRFFKLQPHFPSMKNRKSCRQALDYAMKLEEAHEVKVVNIMTTMIAITYVYHLPTAGLYEAAKNNMQFCRKEAELMLIEDKMSSNWIKEPSHRDFSAIIL
jgi:hypothetical protein